MGYLLEPIGARDRRGQRAYRSPRKQGLIQRQVDLLNAELFDFRRQLLPPLLVGRPVVRVGSVPGSLVQGDRMARSIAGCAGFLILIHS